MQATARVQRRTLFEIVQEYAVYAALTWISVVVFCMSFMGSVTYTLAFKTIPTMFAYASKFIDYNYKVLNVITSSFNYISDGLQSKVRAGRQIITEVVYGLIAFNLVLCMVSFRFVVTIVSLFYQRRRKSSSTSYDDGDYSDQQSQQQQTVDSQIEVDSSSTADHSTPSGINFNVKTGNGGTLNMQSSKPSGIFNHGTYSTSPSSLPNYKESPQYNSPSSASASNQQSPNGSMSSSTVKSKSNSLNWKRYSSNTVDKISEYSRLYSQSPFQQSGGNHDAGSRQLSENDKVNGIDKDMTDNNYSNNNQIILNGMQSNANGGRDIELRAGVTVSKSPVVSRYQTVTGVINAQSEAQTATGNYVAMPVNESGNKNTKRQKPRGDLFKVFNGSINNNNNNKSSIKKGPRSIASSAISQDEAVSVD
ncbi:hypothetical protein MP228_008419 [Amoeboaphelidium protococcarum]|nr:hypothetical protein MP228_008419 [Amoeboaphelidium protococcarum]